MNQYGKGQHYYIHVTKTIIKVNYKLKKIRNFYIL